MASSARLMRRRGVCLAALALLALAAAPAEATRRARFSDFSQEELRSLPRICLAQVFINDELDDPIVPDAERAQVAERYGPTFKHYHHYCWALLLVKRAAAPGGDKFDYRRAVGSLTYVIVRAEPTFALLPEVYFEKGSILEIMGDRAAALSEYQNALRVRADYTPARAAAVQIYIDRGDVPAARTELEEGLKHEPGSKTLAEKKAALEAGAAK